MISARSVIRQNNERMSDDTVIQPSVAPSSTGCVECLAQGGWWFHLRRCAACGHVGCCDSSPSQHASRHAADAGHPIVRSFEPDEDWFWDYVAQEYADGPGLMPPLAHPAPAAGPGPDRPRAPGLAAPPALRSASAGRSREARDQPSGRPTQNATAFVVVELGGVLKLT